MSEKTRSEKKKDHKLKQEQNITMIRAYRQKPVLWDPIYFGKQRLKFKAWIELGEELDIEPVICKRQMKIFTSSFFTEVTRMRKRTDRGLPPRESKWYAYKELLFLLDRKKEVDRLHDQASTIVALYNKDSEQEISVSTGSPKKFYTNTRKSKHTLPTPNEFDEGRQMMMMTSKSKAQVPNQKFTARSTADDDPESFSEYMTSRMLNYTLATRNAVQKAICELMFSVDELLYSDNLPKIQTPSNIANAVQNPRRPSTSIVITKKTTIVRDPLLYLQEVKNENSDGDMKQDSIASNNAQNITSGIKTVENDEIDECLPHTVVKDEYSGGEMKEDSQNVPVSMLEQLLEPSGTKTIKNDETIKNLPRTTIIYDPIPYLTEVKEEYSDEDIESFPG